MSTAKFVRSFPFFQTVNMFLDRIRVGFSDICEHSNECFYVFIQDNGDRILCCRECGIQISLNVYLSDFISSWVSPEDAEEYVKWSGDEQIYCGFKTIWLRNRAPTTRIRTNYSTLAKGCLLLRILHSPFAAKDSIYSNGPTPAGICFFQNTVQTELDHLIERSSCEKNDFFGNSSVGLIAHNALVFLKNIFAFESKRYFDVLVPYVKSNNSMQTPSFSFFHKSVSLNHSLDKRLYESRVIHNKFAKCCAAFDAVHVATLCFLCRDDLSLVYDLVLDFAGKLCCGFFYDDMFSSFKLSLVADSLENRIILLFRRHLSPTLNTRFYKFLGVFWKGGLEFADCFSDTFFKTYWELKSAIVNELPSLEPHFEWVFPRMLFHDYTDYYAFLVTLSYYSTETAMSTKTINEILLGVASSPGIISKCKAKYRFVKMSLSKVKAFHESLTEYQLQRKELKNLDTDDFQLFNDDDIKFQKRYYWSRNMLECFIKCHPEFEKEWVDTTEWLLNLPLYDKTDPCLERKNISFVTKPSGSTSEVESKLPHNACFETLYEYYMKKTDDDGKQPDNINGEAQETAVCA